MIRRPYLRVLWLWLGGSALMLSCVAVPGSGARDDMPEADGEDGGHCRADGTCNPGLVCSLDWCVPPYTSGPELPTSDGDDSDDSTSGGGGVSTNSGDDSVGSTTNASGGDPPPTCNTMCSTDDECGPAEVCLPTPLPWGVCAPMECDDCTPDEECRYSAVECEFQSCWMFSATCQTSCSGTEDCSAGESCTSTLNGNLCLPTECDQQCFPADQQCAYYSDSCDFAQCE